MSKLRQQAKEAIRRIAKAQEQIDDLLFTLGWDEARDEDSENLMADRFLQLFAGIGPKENEELIVAQAQRSIKTSIKSAAIIGALVDACVKVDDSVELQSAMAEAIQKRMKKLGLDNRWWEEKTQVPPPVSAISSKQFSARARVEPIELLGPSPVEPTFDMWADESMPFARHDPGTFAEDESWTYQVALTSSGKLLFRIPKRSSPGATEAFAQCRSGVREEIERRALTYASEQDPPALKALERDLLSPCSVAALLGPCPPPPIVLKKDLAIWTCGTMPFQQLPAGAYASDEQWFYTIHENAAGKVLARYPSDVSAWDVLQWPKA